MNSLGNKDEAARRKERKEEERMKKNFEEPVVEITTFTVEDVVTASSGKDDWSGGDF